ncbi:MAG: NAD-dependent epimerase/dehydratase family protein [Lautropia sp.]|nr:NAD-dependent epimerase/dehydratase family protein [Lautropia sp.]
MANKLSGMISLDELRIQDVEDLIRKARPQFEALAGQHVWLTGGAGFLGYYLVLSIKHWNHSAPPAKKIRLTVLDNYVRGIPYWLNEAQTEEIRLYKHDVTHPIPQNLEPANFIIHAASIASPMYYRKYPLETIDANVNGLRLMLDYAVERNSKSARKHGGKLEGFLFFSTSEIYGDPTPDAIPTPETYRGLVSCTGPRACYDESKRVGETLCVLYAQNKGVPVSQARPFNNYGPGLKITDGRVLPDFARDVLAGRDIVMLSDGSPTRTFCYITDALSGYLKVLVNGRRGEAYNIGIETPEISMKDLAEKVRGLAHDMWGYNGKVIHKVSDEGSVYLADNPNRRCPIITKARSELGYAPEVDVDTGLRRILNWYYFNREAEAA